MDYAFAFALEEARQVNIGERWIDARVRGLDLTDIDAESERCRRRLRKFEKKLRQQRKEKHG